MEKLFNLYKELLIIHPNYKGVVCGYTDVNFILAIESKEGFRKFSKSQNVFILDKYKDVKYRYIFEDERKVLEQIKENGNN